jgi:hypothetical protein
MPLSVSDGQEFSLSGAQKNQRNTLAGLQRFHATKQLFQDLWEERGKIQAVVAHHLRLHEPSACTVQGKDTWLLGQFNICIIVRIHGKDGTTFKKVFRYPMAHKRSAARVLLLFQQGFSCSRGRVRSLSFV